MIQSFKNFFNFDNKMLVYALICNMFDVEIISKVRKLFEFVKNYKNYFDFKNANIFFEYENKNYVLDLYKAIMRQFSASTSSTRT